LRRTVAEIADEHLVVLERAKRDGPPQAATLPKPRDSITILKINPPFLAACRTVHIYLTMLGLVVMLLFAITGFTINHEVALGAARARPTERKGQVPLPLLAQRDHLRVVEHLRKEFGIRGAMDNFADLPDELAIAFKEPAEVWDISIAKATGLVTARQEQHGWVALINNLHRGRYTGPAWRWVIDFSAIVIVLACLTGFVLWLALPPRQKLGIALLVAGTIGTLALLKFLVPGPDVAIPAPAATRTAPP
jgi:hypothetical protein